MVNENYIKFEVDWDYEINKYKSFSSEVWDNIDITKQNFEFVFSDYFLSLQKLDEEEPILDIDKVNFYKHKYKKIMYILFSCMNVKPRDFINFYEECYNKKLLSKLVKALNETIKLFDQENSLDEWFEINIKNLQKVYEKQKELISLRQLELFLITP